MALSSLTHAMLDDLHIGNASLSLLAYPSTGFDPTGADFSTGGQIYTLEDSFNLSCDDPSQSDIKIDQHKEIIDVSIDKGGNWVMTGNIPTQALAVFDEFFDAGATIAAGTASNKTGVTGADGNAYYDGKGYLATPLVVEVAVLAESETKNTAILFPHVKMVLSRPKKDDNSNPLYLAMTGFILPNAKKKNDALMGDFFVLKAVASA